MILLFFYGPGNVYFHPKKKKESVSILAQVEWVDPGLFLHIPFPTPKGKGQMSASVALPAGSTRRIQATAECEDVWSASRVLFRWWGEVWLCAHLPLLGIVRTEWWNRRLERADWTPGEHWGQRPRCCRAERKKNMKLFKFIMDCDLETKLLVKWKNHSESC